MTSFLGLDFASPLSIETEVAEFYSRTRDGTLIGTTEGYPRWVVNIQLEPQSYAKYKPQLLAHRAKHGATIPFKIRMPQTVGSSIPDNGFYNIRQAASRGTDEITAQSAGSYRIVAGRFVVINNHNKVYLVESVRNSGNHEIITLSHDLLADITPSQDILLAPQLTCVYSEGSGGFYEINRASIVTSRISVIEV